MGTNLRDWHRIVASLHDVNLLEERDVFVWALHSSGSFSVKSIYDALINNGLRVSQDLWHIKVPTRMKIFLWYLKKGVILTKDNLARRNWNGDTMCSFCHSPETIQHLFWIVFMLNSCGALFIYCLEYRPPSIDDLFNRWSKMASNDHNSLLLTAASVLCWAVWITRNEVVFDKCRPKSLL